MASTPWAFSPWSVLQVTELAELIAAAPARRVG